MAQMPETTVSGSVGKIDSAESFDESDLSLDLQVATVSGGSIEIDDNANGSKIGLPIGSSASDELIGGFVINPNTDLDSVTVLENQYQNDAPDYLKLRDEETNTVIGQTSISSDTPHTVSPDDGSNLQAGSSYGIYYEGNTQNFFAINATFPEESLDFDIVDGVGNGPYYDMSKIGVTRASLPPESARAYVSWDTPTDIYAWDRVKHQTTPDGESVAIFVEESADGSTWTEIAGPVSRGDRLPADPNNQVRYRVELNRSDTANNPTLDAIYRRWLI